MPQNKEVKRSRTAAVAEQRNNKKSWGVNKALKRWKIAPLMKKSVGRVEK